MNKFNNLKIDGPVFQYRGKIYATQTCYLKNFHDYIKSLQQDQSIAIYQILDDRIRFAILQED